MGWLTDGTGGGVTLAGAPSLAYLTEGRVTRAGSGLLHMGFLLFALVVVALGTSPWMLPVFYVSALLVTDVVSNGSLLLLSRESEEWEEINYPRLDRSLYALKNVVSRKKQLLPLLSQLIATSQA